MCTSFLEGAGYDVFVLLGTALPELTRRNQNHVDCYSLNNNHFHFEDERVDTPFDPSQKQLVSKENQLKAKKIQEIAVRKKTN